MSAAPEAGHFGAVLQRLRVAAGLSQDQLAQHAGLSRRGIADLERGARRKPHPATVRHLADALALDETERMTLLRAAGRLRGGPNHGLPGAARSALPIQRTTLVGRDDALAELERQLQEARLLSLIGAGGVGKTRLALALAAAAQHRFASGACFVELAGLHDPAQVPRVIAGALDIQEQPREPMLQTLIDELGGRELLLVLDNCEHLALPCADVIHSVLRTCPRVRIVVTSRHALGLAGETIWRVPSLSPEASVQLFTERGRSVLAGFAPTDHTAIDVSQICARLDGIPLAIELAATWLSMLSPQQLLSRLDDQLRLLVRGDRVGPSRQQTLRATLDWSYCLLDDAERILLRRLGVFVGGWTLSAAEAIAGHQPLAPTGVLDVLAGLVDKSLVVADLQPPVEPRYRLLEPVRQYAAERASAAGETEGLQRQHCRWYQRWAEQVEPLLYGAEQASWLDCLESEYDNLRAALSWAHAHDARLGLRLAASLGSFWGQHGHLTEGSTWLQSLLALVDDRSIERARALLVLGELQRRADASAARDATAESVSIYAALGDSSAHALALQQLGQALYHTGSSLPEARTYLEAGVAMFRRVGDAAGAGWALAVYGMLSRGWGESGRAEALLNEALPLLRPSGDANRVAFVLNNLGQAARVRGDYQTAHRYTSESVRHFRRLGIRTHLIFALINNANHARLVGEIAGATEQLREALTLANAGGMLLFRVQALTFVAILLVARGGADTDAVRLFGATSSHSDAFMGLDADELKDREAARALACLHLGDHAFEQAWAEGERMSLDEAVASALALL